MNINEILDIRNIFDISQTISSNIFKNLSYPWEALRNINSFILESASNLSSNEYKQIKPNVWASVDANIDASAFISGPTIIQKNAQIRHCAFIRGNAIIGEDTVVGNSTELKNVILFNGVQIPHYNYIGDSILGYKVHFGAGAVTSNVKSDKSLVSVHIGDRVINTNFKKFGAIVGDFSEIGCNAVLNPGTILCRNTTIYPLSMVRGVVEENNILKNTGISVKKNKFTF